MKKGIIITILILFVIGGTALAITLSKPKKSTNNNASTSISVDQSSGTTSNTSNTTGSTINFNGAEFEPNSLTVSSGNTITVKNASSSTIQFDSDPHPQHTDNTELNIGVIKPGESGTMTLTTKGTFGYHNHLNSAQKGTITVN